MSECPMCGRATASIDWHEAVYLCATCAAEVGRPYQCGACLSMAVVTTIRDRIPLCLSHWEDAQAALHRIGRRAREWATA